MSALLLRKAFAARTTARVSAYSSAIGHKVPGGIRMYHFLEKSKQPVSICRYPAQSPSTTSLDLLSSFRSAQGLSRSCIISCSFYIDYNQIYVFTHTNDGHPAIRVLQARFGANVVCVHIRTLGTAASADGNSNVGESNVALCSVSLTSVIGHVRGMFLTV